MFPYFDWSNVSLLPHSPSGNTSAAARLLYQWQYANYLGSIPPERTTDLWSGPIYVFGFLFILALSLWFYSRLSHAHRSRGELYGVESFGGVILERIGPIDVLTYITIIICVLWAAYFFISQIIYGQVY